ncbi:MAG: hypothetical protein FJY75_06075 [Candidatus Eisenbacteria bacterium]|uniref:PKD domain-containing protein n=1 Tax=Eiseniibacteriota bacterium TaxID=2212470 RepID=A0A938BQP2_UNCEI|nr:hypothetical protein [Candidatus Eisenbacteria bacterium]
MTMVALLFVAGCGDDKSTTPTNRSPQILSVTVAPGSVPAGGVAVVTVSATDPDGDALTYAYQVTGGAIVGAGASATWTAPSTAGAHSVTVTVSDGNGGTAQGNGALTVQAAQTGITGTITAPAGVQADLRNMLVKLYESFGSYQADAPFVYVAAQGNEYQVTFQFTGLAPGLYYLDAWKDMDGSGTYTNGDIWGVYATGAWPNWTVAPISVTQGNMTNCSAGLIVFQL